MQYYIYNVLGINLLTNTLILICNLQNIKYPHAQEKVNEKKASK